MMISKALDKIQKDLDFIKEIANEENFKRLEERCNFVNTRNKELQDKLNKIRETITLRNQEMTKLLYIELLEILEGKNEKR